MKNRHKTNLIAARGNGGFTLIEMAICIIIIGIMVTPMIGMYQAYQMQKKVTQTRDNIDFISMQISNFVGPQGRYPCPADRALPVTDANYGREFDANCDPAAIGLTVGSCTPNGGICMVEAGAAGLSTDHDGDGAKDPVLIGAVPIRSIRDVNVPDGFANLVPDESAIDGWKNKLTYAVSATMTNSATYNPKWGVIDAVNERYTPTANINGDGHYAIISHGPDGKGAFTMAGSKHRNCGSIVKDFSLTPIGITSDARDNENCNDQDTTFMQSISMYKGNSANYFDDIVYFVKSRNSNPWQYISTSSGITENIRNTNNNNVGILNTNPTEKLDVTGTIKADNNVLVSKICDTSGANCFDVNKIAGTGMACPSGQVAKGITNGSIVCVTPTFSSINPTNCSPGYVKGIRTDGSVLCTP